MDKDAGEKENSRNCGKCPNHLWHPLRIGRLEMAGKGQHNQKGNDQPTVMDSNLNAENATKPDTWMHGDLLIWARSSRIFPGSRLCPTGDNPPRIAQIPRGLEARICPFCCFIRAICAIRG